MPTALVLSGGGSRGAFEVGAVRYLYDQGVRPDIISGCSAGSINGAKLAEGEGAADQGLQGLERFWLDLRFNGDMWREEPWLSEIPERFRRVLTTGEMPNLAGPWTMSNTWGDILPPVFNFFFDLGFLFFEAPSLLEDLQLLATKVQGARGIYNLGPVAEKLAGNPPAVDPAKVRAWSAGGRKLRLATVALESGRVRHVTETGDVLEADGTRVTMLTTNCGALRQQVSALEAQVKALQDELRMAVGSEKPPLVARMRLLSDQLRGRRQELATCMGQTTATPLTVPLHTAIIASASMPGIFPPVRMGDETYVDGGVRELLPIKAAIDLGGDPIYAIEASAPGVKPKGSYANAGLADVVVRALVDIAIDEVGMGESRPLNGFGSRTVHLIEPTFDLYEVTDIVPGLIRATIDYGWMRAADVVTVAADKRADARRLSDEISRLRYEAYAAETLALTPEIDQPSRANHLERAGDFKRQIKQLIEERRSKGYPVPGHAERWWTHWEWHSQKQDDVFPATTNPFGSVDEVVYVPGAGVRVRGWVIDPNSADPVDVNVYVDSDFAAAATSNRPRPDVGAAHPGYGDAHGFELTVETAGGQRSVCVYALNAGLGTANPQLGCRQVTIPTAPFGSVDEVARNGNGVRVRGWAVDPNTVAPIDVHVYVNGQMAAGVTANRSRPDVAAAHPGYGDAHGYEVDVPTAIGTHRVCVYAINVGPGAVNPELGCRTVSVEPEACPGLRARRQQLSGQITALQAELSGAVGAEKAAILARIKPLQTQLTQVRSQMTSLGCP